MDKDKLEKGQERLSIGQDMAAQTTIVAALNTAIKIVKPSAVVIWKLIRNSDKLVALFCQALKSAEPYEPEDNV